MKTLCLLLSGNLGFILLEHLYLSYHIELVFTDSKSDNIINFCDKKGIDIFIGNPRNHKASNFINQRNTDILISINYLFIVESDIISIATDLAFNVHGSLLPKYRGRTPHVWAIINNEKQAGITAHCIDEGCDTGDIIEQIQIPISLTDTGNDILLKYNKQYIPLVDSVLQNFEKGLLSFQKQEHSEATYFGKRDPSDGLILWDWQKERLYNWVRAQAFPYPGAFSFYDNKKITIDKVSFSDKGYDYSVVNGTIVDVRNNIPYIKTPNGVIKLEQIREKDTNFEKGKIFVNKQVIM